MQYAASVVGRYNEDAECRITYRYGIAESRYDSIYQVKMLMMKAIEKCSRFEEDTAALLQQSGKETGTETALDLVRQEDGPRVERDTRRSSGPAREGRRSYRTRETLDGEMARDLADQREAARLDQLLDKLEKARSNK